jgi:hypothetical protein
MTFESLIEFATNYDRIHFDGFHLTALPNLLSVKSKQPQGPYYSYRMSGEKKTVQFWIAPPPAIATAPTGGIPIEIAVVSVKPDNGSASVIWPGELKGKELGDALAPFWPQTNNQPNKLFHSTSQ